MFGKGKTEAPSQSLNTGHPLPLSGEVYFSAAELAHHTKYFGSTGWKDANGKNRVPTPQEVVNAGLESPEYLEQFKR